MARKQAEIHRVARIAALRAIGVLPSPLSPPIKNKRSGGFASPGLRGCNLAAGGLYATFVSGASPGVVFEDGAFTTFVTGAPFLAGLPR